MGVRSKEVDKHDLSTGSTTRWFYAPGSDLYVVGLINGSPVITISDGTSTRWVLVTGPNQPQPLDTPFTSDPNVDYTGFVGAPMGGAWFGSPDGVYLWTPRTGGVLVSGEPAVPAGTCA